ncbi:AmmeMemoRadiSam system protein A [Pyramidobacter piscolens]|uniref:AmmeMemoRadiSam system protein A n=1 Tax=Pyramidobacter piscolens TaxID=638849 RepID=UPI002AB1A32B|nr:AmmeMemoRadiSam system protein A [Pyramidobacter piscolens]
MAILGAFAVPHPPVILPEIGRGEEKKIQATIDAYREAARRAAALKPDVLIVLSPHAVMYRDYFHISPGRQARGSFAAFGRPDAACDVSYDGELVEAIGAEAAASGIPAGKKGERRPELDHGTMIPLRFFCQSCGGLPIVRIGLSGLPLLEHYNFGTAIARAAERLGRRPVVVASGDLSHKLKADGPYGFAPEGPEFDRRIMEIFSSGDFGAMLEFNPVFCEKAAECGLRSFVIMAGAFDGYDVESEILSYEGPFGVGYGVACFAPRAVDEGRRFERSFLQRERETLRQTAAREDAYVKLARLSLEHYVKSGRVAGLPDGLPEELTKRRAGVFVSVTIAGELRGCIGTIEPTRSSVAEEILYNAVSAGTRDPRFAPVTETELPRLVYDVDVLSPAEPAAKDDLDVRRYGVIVSSGRRKGLLLPDLDGVDTVERQLDIALRKAGIGRGENYSLQRFEVVRHR